MQASLAAVGICATRGLRIRFVPPAIRGLQTVPPPSVPGSRPQLATLWSPQANMDIRSFFAKGRGGAKSAGNVSTESANKIEKSSNSKDKNAKETTEKNNLSSSSSNAPTLTARKVADAKATTTPSIFTKKQAEESSDKRKREEDLEELKAKKVVVKEDSKGGKRVQVQSSPKKKSEVAKAVDDGVVPYGWVADAFDKIEATTKRLEIQRILCGLFNQVLSANQDALLPCVYICSGQVAPAFHGIEMGVGDALLMKAIANSTGRTKSAISSKYEEHGDLGTVAMVCKKSQNTIFGAKPKPLSVDHVFAQMRKISEIGAQDAKEKLIHKLLVNGVGTEPKYLVRFLQGKLRIGLAEQTVVISLAHALCEYHYQQQLKAVGGAASESVDSDDDIEDVEEGDDKTKPIRIKWNPADAKIREEAVNMLKQVQCELPVYEEILKASLKPTEPNEMWYTNLRKECHIRAGVPLKPMLAKPTNGVSVVLDRFADRAFSCEYKYDGERAQIHMTTDDKNAPEVKVYSRNSEDNTVKYPDIVQDILAAFSTEGESGVSSFIMDAEAVAYDVEKATLLPFQILSTRARKDVNIEDVKVKVIVCAFDLLYLNGESLLEKPLEERRDLLRKHFKPVEHKFCFAQSMDGTDTEEIEAFLNKAVEDKCEGLMVKALQGPESFYAPARRSLNWLKLKKDYLNNLADSLDLVPIGAFHGRGKRTGVYGAYVLACYDPDLEQYQSITKIGTGFSDEVLKEFTDLLKQSVVEERPSDYDCDLTPDVWFTPTQVWEVRAADLSISPLHRAAVGKIDPGKGIALRFPRFLRIRDDKAVEDATNALQVAEMYSSQSLASDRNAMEEDF